MIERRGKSSWRVRLDIGLGALNARSPSEGAGT